MRLFSKALLGLVALIAVAALAGIVITWAPDKPMDALRTRWAQPPSQFIELQGLTVHYRDEGPRDDPRPVVLLHGTSSSLHTWEGWVSALKGEHRMISMDLPGFGLTGPDPQGDYGIDAYTRFTLRFLDALGVQRFVLAGNSLGGEIAWHVAAAAPDRVERLVLVDAGGYASTATSVPIGFRLAKMPALHGILQHLLPRGVIESSLRNLYGDPSRVTTLLVDRVYDMTLRAGNRAALMRRSEQARPGADVDRIKTLTLPTLILWGARDRLIPPQYAEEFRRDIAGSTLVMYEDLGHVPHEENPARTVADVQRFLAR